MEGAADSGRARAARRRRAAAAAALAATACLAAALFAPFFAGAPPSGRDPNAALGQLEGKSAEERQAELDRIVEEGMFGISIARYVEMPEGGAEAELRIENVPANRYLMKVRIVRDDTGETVYESGLLEPNSHIQRAPLSARLEAGTHRCTAEFSACDPATEDVVGTAAASITIAVRS